MDDLVVIALFRHSLTEANKRKAYLGWSDSPLCPITIDHSQMRMYDCYFSSDLTRCISTGKMLFPQAVPIRLKEFRELNFGKWEGKTYEDLRNDTLYQQWLTAPERFRPPNGESYLEFIHRVEAGWNIVIEKILSGPFKSAAIITHGGPIKFLLTKFAPIQKEFWSWQVPHDQGFELIFNREQLRRGERCISLQEVPLTVKRHG
ncbi:histidine phosphatase family protein [Neobacillus thermocopriae]|uniref:histidine phosphatase family protein n=1 Tax=Neobacillus thermocopriae TaxID=1215031 RepID=UPI002E2165C5|nr:phosphoglycerate mutase family protein [Neobacillus thermocopriae]